MAAKALRFVSSEVALVEVVFGVWELSAFTWHVLRKTRDNLQHLEVS